MLIYKCPLKVGLLSVTFELKRRHFSAIAELLFCTSVSAGFVELTVSRVLFVSAAGLAMLIAQGTTQMVAAETTTVANSSPPITVETKPASAPNELSALMSTTALVASHADNCDSFNDLESANADVDGFEQETNL